MKALVFHAPKHVTVDEHPDPRIEHPRDVILRVTSTAICGSDLHCVDAIGMEDCSLLKKVANASARPLDARLAPWQHPQIRS